MYTYINCWLILLHTKGDIKSREIGAYVGHVRKMKLFEVERDLIKCG